MGLPIQTFRSSPTVWRAVRSAATARSRQREDRTDPAIPGSRVQQKRFLDIANKVSTPEYIGCKKRTQGTETSKYLKERTSTETP